MSAYDDYEDAYFRRTERIHDRMTERKNDSGITNAKTYYLTGKIWWTKAVEPESHPTYNPQGSWSTTIGQIDADLRAKITEAGLDHKIKEDLEHPELGGEILKLRRKCFNRKNQKQEPPVFRGPDNKPWPRDWVRNGTLAIVAVNTYDTPLGKGHSLVGIQVLEEPAGKFDPNSVFEQQQEYMEEMGGDVFGDMS